MFKLKNIISKIVVALLFICFIIVIYIAEKNYYNKKTYLYYKSTQVESNENNPSIKVNQFSDYVVKENATAKNEKRVAYLTFDDGPSDVTPKILEVLDKYNIKATFFLIGNSITEDKEDLVKNMINNGHLIGIHTYSHDCSEIYNSAQSYIDDVNKTYEKLYNITSIKPIIYRFPWGSANFYIKDKVNTISESLSEKNLTYYDWNVSAEDSVGTPTKQSIINNIKNDFSKYNEPVILMHDSSINDLTAETLPEIIEMIQAEGYEFDIVTNRTNPYQYKH